LPDEVSCCRSDDQPSSPTDEVDVRAWPPQVGLERGKSASDGYRPMIEEHPAQRVLRDIDKATSGKPHSIGLNRVVNHLAGRRQPHRHTIVIGFAVCNVVPFTAPHATISFEFCERSTESRWHRAAAASPIDRLPPSVRVTFSPKLLHEHRPKPPRICVESSGLKATTADEHDDSTSTSRTDCQVRRRDPAANHDNPLAWNHRSDIRRITECDTAGW